MKKANRITLRHLLLGLAVVLGIAMIQATSCNDKSTPITIKAVDCPKDMINISVTATPVPKGPDWVAHFVITVTCNGAPIDGAEVSAQVSSWFTKTWKTNAKGQIIENSSPPKQGDPEGQTVKVTVVGSDGEKSEEVKVTK